MSYIDEVRQILTATLDLTESDSDLDLATPLLGSIPELDSMAVVSVLTAIEEQYDVIIEDDEISAEAFETIGTLVEFVKEKCG